MKKYFAILCILAMVGAFGCCSDPTGVSTTKSFAFCWDKVVDVFCSNRAAIESAMSAASTTIATIQAEYGTNLPPAAQTALNAAQMVITTGQTILASATCPTSTDVANIQAALIASDKARANLNAERWTKGQRLIP